MVAVFDLLDDSREFPAQSFVQPDAEDLADPVRRQPPQTNLATSLEDLVNREVAPEDKIAAVFDLRHRVEPR